MTPREQVRMTATIDPEAVSDLILRYGEERYRAGAGMREDVTSDEHAARLEVAGATFRELLRLVFSDTALVYVPEDPRPNVVEIRP